MIRKHDLKYILNFFLYSHHSSPITPVRRHCC